MKPALQLPAQFTPGSYVIHHEDYVKPLTIKVTQNVWGTTFWKAFIGDSAIPFKHQMYLREKTAKDFWSYVYNSLTLVK